VHKNSRILRIFNSRIQHQDFCGILVYGIFEEAGFSGFDPPTPGKNLVRWKSKILSGFLNLHICSGGAHY
jgi:hypothetical protein